uniref:Rho GTPase-activating protein gacII-like n=1 Tax=Crassostrea virginica TaxID=6565 RepID=A0A8B8AWS7_CRAVI|nr:rho GTPase-activating protein gacII-like [Crassostrea virginica]
MDKTLIFVAFCLSAVSARFPPVCELECISGYIGDIAECRTDFPYRPGTPNKDLKMCLLEIEHDRNVCMVMNRDPLCKQMAPMAFLHKPFIMDLNQPKTTITPMTTTTTTTTTPPPRTAAPIQNIPVMSQPSQSPNRLIHLYVDQSNNPPQYRHHGLVGKPSNSFLSPVALEPMPMQPPAGLTVAEIHRHNRIQNMIQRTVPQAMNTRPLPSPRKMQLPDRPLPKQMQLPGQTPQPINVQHYQQPQSIVRTNPRIIQRRLTVYKLAKAYEPSPINRPVQPSFSAHFNYAG